MKFGIFKSITLITLLVFSFGLLVNLSTALSQSPIDEIIGGTTKTGVAAGFPTTEGEPKKDFIVVWGTYAVNFAAIMSALFLLLMIYAGWLWMSARGNEEQVLKAKKIMIGALIGLVIIITGRIITELTLNYLGQTIVTQ